MCKRSGIKALLPPGISISGIKTIFMCFCDRRAKTVLAECFDLFGNIFEIYWTRTQGVVHIYLVDCPTHLTLFSWFCICICQLSRRWQPSLSWCKMFEPSPGPKNAGEGWFFSKYVLYVYGKGENLKKAPEKGEKPTKTGCFLVLRILMSSFANRDERLCSSNFLRFHFSNEEFGPFFLQNILATYICSNINLISHPLISDHLQSRQRLHFGDPKSFAKNYEQTDLHQLYINGVTTACCVS